MHQRTITFRISLRAFLGFQCIVVTALLLMSLFAYLYADIGSSELFLGVLKPFDVGREQSFSTWFSSFNLALASLLLFATYAKAKDISPDSGYWLGLSLILLSLSIDEVAGVHERLGTFNEYVGLSIPTVVGSSWFIWGAAFALLVLIIYIRFLMRLDKALSRLIILAGAIFTMGAVGFEYLGDILLYYKVAEKDDLVYNVRRLFEEGCEMYAIVLFNWALLKYALAESAVFLEIDSRSSLRSGCRSAAESRTRANPFGPKNP